MKKILVLAFLFSLVQIAKAQIAKGTLQASGLTCSMCNLSIKKSLEKLPFIEAIKPNVETATYELTFKNGASINLVEVKNAVEKAGFSVAQLAFEVDFNNIQSTTNNSFQINGISYNIVGASKQNKPTGVVNYFITDKGFLSEKKYKKFKNSNKTSSSQTIINITQIA